jgi:primosomal protein N' (replication factor Y)
VAVDAPRHVGLDDTLSYRSQCPLAPGTLVRVPLGRRQVAGLVWDGDRVGDKGADAGTDSTAEAGPALRDVAEICDALPPLPPAWRELARFAATYYQRSVGELALSVLPPELRRLDAAGVADRIRRLHKHLARNGAGEASEPARPELTGDQAAAVDALVAALVRPDPGAVLLHGVTGSGKTEVYLRASEAVLATGRQALVLVPEINLTPQLVSRFAARFAGRRIVALHSGLTPAQRLRSWLAAHLGLADLVLGTRLAVFASAAARPRGRRRGARPLLQAAGRRPLLGARPGVLAAAAKARRCCSARRRRRWRAGPHARRRPLLR